MADAYYYQDAQNQVQGPFAPSALKQLANDGVIVESTPVRKGEQGAWYAAGTIAGLVSPQPANAEVPPLRVDDDAAERARRTLRKAEEHADKVAAKLWFLDLKFSQFFTPKLLGALWAVYLCLLVLLFIGSVVSAFLNYNPFLAILLIPVDFVVLTFAAIYGRVKLEFVLVMFRVAERLEPLQNLEFLKHLEKDEKAPLR